MKEQEYIYHTILVKPTEIVIEEKRKEGWEPCDAPEGTTGRDLEKEPSYAHSVFYFRKKSV